MRIEFSKIVKRDAFLRCNGNCEDCGLRLKSGEAQYDHIIALGIGGESTLENCQVLCGPCHRLKTSKKDIPAIAKTKRIQDRERGIRKASKFQSRGFAKAPAQRSATRPLARAFD